MSMKEHSVFFIALACQSTHRFTRQLGSILSTMTLSNVTCKWNARNLSCSNIEVSVHLILWVGLGQSQNSN